MSKIFIGDLEADGLLGQATQVWCGSFVSLDGKEKISFSPYSHANFLQEMLAFMDSCSCLIFHNGIDYDFPLLRKLYGYEYKGEKIDTIVMSRLMNPKRPVPPHCPIKNRPHAVDTWGYRVGRGKVKHDDWSQLSHEMIHRCEEDAQIQRLIYLSLLEEKKGYNWDGALKLSFKLFEVLQKQEEYGWLVDRAWIDKSLSMLNHWMVRLDKVLGSTLPMTLEVEEQKVGGQYKHVKAPFLISGAYNKNVLKWMDEVGLNPEERPVWGPFTRVLFRRISLDKSGEVKDYLLEQGWEPAVWNTNDDGERTSPKLDKNDPFDGVDSGVGKLIAKYTQCKSRRSIVEGWLDLIRPDGRIPSSVANLAETGRATHRNIVNVPNASAFFGKWMRKAFISKPGWVLVSADSEGNQLRQLCARMGDEAYQQNVLFGEKEKGTDIHSVNMKAAGLKTRDLAKTFIYGFLFGAGDAKIGRIVGGNSEAGRKLKEQFLEGLPALAELLDRLVKEWRKNAKRRPGKWGRIEYYDGWLEGLDGRPIKVASEHAILVYMLQSDEAIQMAAAYIWMYKELISKYKWGEDFGIVCWYHDEYTIECRPEIAEDCANIMEECIVKAGKYYKIACPHQGKAKIGLNWYAVH